MKCWNEQMKIELHARPECHFISMLFLFRCLFYFDAHFEFTNLKIWWIIDISAIRTHKMAIRQLEIQAVVSIINWNYCTNSELRLLFNEQCFYFITSMFICVQQFRVALFGQFRALFAAIKSTKWPIVNFLIEIKCHNTSNDIESNYAESICNDQMGCKKRAECILITFSNAQYRCIRCNFAILRKKSERCVEHSSWWIVKN